MESDLKGAELITRMKRSRRRAFSLIEVLISMAILSFGLLAIFMLHNTALSGNSLAGKISTCAVLAQDLMERLQGLEYKYGDEVPEDLEDIGEDPTTDADPLAFLPHPNNGGAPDPINSLGNTDSSQAPLSFYRTWDISYPDPSDRRLMQIKVRVTFQDGMTGRYHGVTITSFKMVDPSD